MNTHNARERARAILTYLPGARGGFTDVHAARMMRLIADALDVIRPDDATAAAHARSLASKFAQLADDCGPITRVTYRRFRDGEVIALLWDVPANPGCVESYMRVGQHFEADYPNIVPMTRPADYETDAKDLHDELLWQVGYLLEVVPSRPRRALP